MFGCLHKFRRFVSMVFKSLPEGDQPPFPASCVHRFVGHQVLHITLADKMVKRSRIVLWQNYFADDERCPWPF